MKSVAAFDATKATEAHWWKTATVVKVTHTTERRTASVKLQGLNWNEVSQWARATHAEKGSAALQEHVRKLMTEEPRLMARCDKLAFENTCLPGLTKEVKEAGKLCPKV